MSVFVLEIGFEEMPARFLGPLAAELENSLHLCLAREMIQYKSIEVYSTPRRLCVHVGSMSRLQDSRQEIVTGPPEAVAFDDNKNLTRAGLGFARSQQVDAADLFVHKTQKGRYLAAKKTLGGRPSIAVLPDVSSEIIRGLNFPKKMRWADGFSFGRPIRWILAMLDDSLVSFNISDVQSGKHTYGHRVLGPGPFELAHAQDYPYVLEQKGRVVLNPEKRMEMIKAGNNELVLEKQGKVVQNEDLVRETSNLVEFPVSVLGGFDERYLELPREVLLTSMETHQKSFGVEGDDNTLRPYFLTVINNNPEDIDLVRKGWERVLKARLEDAMFFWNSDKSVSFKTWHDKLERVVFLASLGSMADKARRLEKIAGFICDQLGMDSRETVCRAALICKCDLVSEMVGEFPDLQGVMGGIYAGLAGYSQEVVHGVYEHYLPLGPESAVPGSMAGAIVAISDKVDNLTGCFGLNMIPTGTADPYALRRQALGIIRIILEHGLDLDLPKIISFCKVAYTNARWKQDLYKLEQSLMQFFAARLKSYWQGMGHDGKIIDAVIQSGCDNMLTAQKKLSALLSFSQLPDFEAAVLTFKRIDNIVRKQGHESGAQLPEGFDPHLLEDKYEIRLAGLIDEVLSAWDMKWAQGEFESLFSLLNSLRPQVDDFFDNVMVMCEDKRLRQNRLGMLHVLSKKLRTLADFSALQV